MAYVLTPKGNEAQSCQSFGEKFDANMRGKERRRKRTRSMKNPERTTVEETRFRYESLPLYGVEKTQYEIEKS